MYKRIIIITHDGDKFTGDIYKVNKTSPVIFGYPPHITKQEFDELEKLMLTYAIIPFPPVTGKVNPFVFGKIKL